LNTSVPGSKHDENLMIVYLNNLTKCEIIINEKITKQEIIDKAVNNFNLIESSVQYSLSVWIEHKENKDIDEYESPFKAWDQNKNVPRVKFHLHRMRDNIMKQSFIQLGPDMASFKHDESIISTEKKEFFSSVPKNVNKSTSILLLMNDVNRRSSTFVQLEKKKNLEKKILFITLKQPYIH